MTEPGATETETCLVSLLHERAGGVPERCGASRLPYINIVSIDIIVLANCSTLLRERELQRYGFIIHNTVCAYCLGIKPPEGCNFTLLFPVLGTSSLGFCV